MDLVYKLGELINMSDYADSLSSIADNGAREFYEGDLSKIIIEDIEKNDADLLQKKI